jgi:hypothetical protein
MSMRGPSRLERDREGLTAVIEFLSAFTLFLMILTAFLALAQMQMGSNDPHLDRLDRAAVLGLDRLVADEGWFTPFVDGEADPANGTTDWHLEAAEDLFLGRVRPGLVVDGVLSVDRVAALSKVTESGFAAGLGLDDALDVRLRIEALDENGTVVEVLFDGGTDRRTAESSSRATRLAVGQDGLVRLSLEVHDGGRAVAPLIITEVQSRPLNGGPEWFEVHNPEGFAVELRGWSFHILTRTGSIDHLMLDGMVSGGGVALMTGDLASQDLGQATEAYDLGEAGLLGVGLVDMLPNGEGTLRMNWTDPLTSRPALMQQVDWGGDTGHFMSPGQSLVLNGTLPSDPSSWSVAATPTPGQPEV